MRKIDKIKSGALRILSTLFDGHQDWFQSKPTTYTAEFITSSELNRWNKGVAITGAKAGTRSLAYEGTGIFASTGAGKTASVILGSCISLARGGSSLVFNDIQNELYEKTSGFLQREGYRILRIDFRNPILSEGFNPLDFVVSESDLNLIAVLVHLNTEGEPKGDKFWQNSSVMLLTLILRYLYNFTPQYLNFQNALRIVERLSYDAPSVHKLFIRCGDEDLLSAYQSTVSMSPNTLQSVIASLRSVLGLWQIKEVCKTTNKSSFKLKDLRKSKVAIYCCTPIQDLHLTRPITALLYHTLFNYVLSNPVEDEDNSIFFVLEEFASYNFPDFANTAALIRKRRAGLICCMQDEQALVSRYGISIGHQIKTNLSTKIYLKGQPLQTCVELSKILGSYSYESETGEKKRELLTPDEIRIEERAIILIRNYRPLREHMVLCHENVWMAHLFKIPPAIVENKCMNTPEVIQFDK